MDGMNRKERRAVRFASARSSSRVTRSARRRGTRRVVNPTMLFAPGALAALRAGRDETATVSDVPFDPAYRGSQREIDDELAAS
jgi:hypothetical protein